MLMFGVVPPIPCEHCGKPARYQTREALQAPYLGMYQALVGRIRDFPPDVPVYQTDLNRWLVEIADEQPDAATQRAINTTTYGSE